MEYAVTSRASDIHIEPQEDRVRVRYRIDGILYDRLSLPKSVQEAVISRIKILSEMKIDEHRTPQDGRFNFKIEDKEVDLRISVLPTSFGEKIVMRLLRKSGGVPTLQELGLNRCVFTEIWKRRCFGRTELLLSSDQPGREKRLLFIRFCQN